MSARKTPAKRRAEKPVDSEIRRAAKRAGIDREKLGAAFKAETGVDPDHVTVTVTPAPSERDVARTMIGHSLVQATELIAELMASYDMEHVIEDVGTLRDRLSEISAHLWRLRWDYSILPCNVAFHAERGAGGAS